MHWGWMGFSHLNQCWLLGREELPWRARQRLFVSLCLRACVLACSRHHGERGGSALLCERRCRGWGGSAGCMWACRDHGDSLRVLGRRAVGKGVGRFLVCVS